MNFTSKLGFISGPLLIILGLYTGNVKGWTALPIFCIVFGIVRLAMTAYLYYNHPDRKG
jgi:hypothetical protein